MERTPFALAIFLTLGFGAMIAIARSGAAVLFGLIALFNILMWLYLDGPASSATVRWGTLEISNPIVRYMVPREHVVSIESFDRLGVRVSLAGGRRVWVRALSFGRYRLRNPTRQEILARANRLGEALSASPAAADAHPELETRYRWANLLGICIGVIGLGVGFYLSHHLT
jgi:hypothetical protein